MTVINARIEALLDRQYEAMISGEPFTFVPEQYGLTSEQANDAHQLLHLAHRLSSILVPVLPSAEFETRLKNELVGADAPPLILRWRKLPAGTRLAARLGGITLTAGLALLASRRVISVLNALSVARTKQPKAVTLPLNPLS
jgi:hypothetical protein